MDEILKKSYIVGVERVSAWADLLDAINVFPIADGDTGRNLSVSLSPLRFAGEEKDKITHGLLMAARGNSGNIASQFFAAFYVAASFDDLASAVREGRNRAWKAINDPQPGTMLSLFDALLNVFDQEKPTPDPSGAAKIIARLEKAVKETRDILPRLKETGVVDAGALGLYIFFDGFFNTLAGATDHLRPVTEIFPGLLQISSDFREKPDNGYCVDFVMEAKNCTPEQMAEITREQNNVLIIPQAGLYKIHLHTYDRDKMKAEMSALGKVLNWEDDNLAVQISSFTSAHADYSLHIMTDAAGSLTRDDAKKYGFTLLASYLNVGNKSLPETYFQPEELYRAMRAGVKVSTSQSSVFERHQSYAAALARFQRVLYLCVGSFFTGNYNVAREWKKENDPNDRFLIIDTGAASGRLGTIVLATARYLARTKDAQKAYDFAKEAVVNCEEYVFLEKLQYLAAGGRLSKTSAFFGDMLKMKPVISPQPEGAKKVAVVRNRKDQIKLALEKMSFSLKQDAPALIMLEYSDNIEQVSEFGQKVQKLYPRAEVILQPLSLTSGAHMGPGTWAVAFLPEAT